MDQVQFSAEIQPGGLPTCRRQCCRVAGILCPQARQDGGVGIKQPEHHGRHGHEQRQKQYHRLSCRGAHVSRGVVRLRFARCGGGNGRHSGGTPAVSRCACRVGRVNGAWAQAGDMGGNVIHCRRLSDSRRRGLPFATWPRGCVFRWGLRAHRRDLRVAPAAFWAHQKRGFR